MIGLEYILDIYNVMHQDLAETLGIKKQNINLWIKGKQNISKKYIPKLSEMFKIPEEYFQKDVDEVDKLKIQRIKHDNDYVEIVDTYIDRETGEEVAFRYEDFEHERYGNLLTYEIKVEELRKNLQQTIDNELESDDEYIHPDKLQDESEKLVNVYTEFVNIIKESPKAGREMLQRIITGIRMYQGKNESDDELSKDICSALKKEEKRGIEDILENEDEYRAQGFGEYIDKLKREHKY